VGNSGSLPTGKVSDPPPAFQSSIFLFQTLQPLRLIHTQATVLLLPAILSLFGDAEFATGLDASHAFAQLILDGAQMANDLFCAVPFPCHAPSFRRLEF
jgi:hypothetical protein